MCLCCVSARGQIDTSLNQTVWKMLYGVTAAQAGSAAWLAADDDGDGLSNGGELSAGTNPFSAGSTVSVAALPVDDATVSLTFSSVAGKLYVVQATGTLGPAAVWAGLSPNVQWLGDGKSHTFAVPRPGEMTFFRLLVQDVDTDGDGVSDWAEKCVGYDPTNAHSHGATQDDRQGLGAALAAENVVTVSASKAQATQPPDATTPATDTGTLTVTRSGTLRFSALTVPLAWGGTAKSGQDYMEMPATVTIPPKTSSVTLTLIPKANPNRQSSATATLVAQAGPGYQVGAAKSASVLISPAESLKGTGLTGYYYQDTQALIGAGYHATNLFNPTNLKLKRLDPTIDFTWTSPAQPTGLNSTYYTVRWLGQVQPQYSETYYFDTKTDDGVKLWVNGQLLIDGWSNQTADRIAGINLKAGVLYDIKMEYYQGTSSAQAHLYWFSDSQPKQVIPASRLYPDTSTPAPPAITSPPTAIGFAGQPFSYTTTASTSGGGAPTFALAPDSMALPDNLTLNANTGLISGTVATPGEYQIALTATNANGTGAGTLTIQILPPGSGVTRELWQNLTGPAVSDLPLTKPPTTTDVVLAPLEDKSAYASNTGERLRGYFTAPATGNYYFWLAASNAAELWISNDDDPVNLVRRAMVIAPGTALQTWNDPGQPGQRSAWIALTAGKSYYYEVLHNTGSAGSGSHVSVGWLQDPTGAATQPAASGSGVVPAYLLTRYSYPAAASATGTLYVTNLSPQGVAVSSGSGAADLRMNADNTQAILHFNYGGLSSPRTAYHIHAAADSTGSGPIVFDLDEVDTFHPELKTADGGYIWNITAAGALSAAQIVQAVQQGYAYFNVHTVNYPNGEIRGNLRLVQGSQTAPAPVADPGFTDDSSTDAGAARFLHQAAFGAGPTDLTYVKANGYRAWIDQQMGLAATLALDDTRAHPSLDPSNPLPAKTFQNAWWRAAVTAPDQLRQRAAFAWSQILVISSSNATLSTRADGLASYYDTLAVNAFGNFRDLLKAVTLHPSMGYFLNMQGNAKGNVATGLHPNENYGREIMQLFSVGLNRLWSDGTLVLDAQANLVPTYDQEAIGGMARVFTGWNWAQALQQNGRLPTSFSPSANYVSPMVLVPNYHELGSKRVLNNVVLPPAVGYNYPAAATAGSQADSSTTAFDAYCAGDLERALDNIFQHPNVGPYICRQLIQRLVASNPSPGYVGRVVAIFNDDGTAQHVRGNMAAVFRAILLDGEARNLQAVSATTGGKQREPILRITSPARTFPFAANSGNYQQSGGILMTLTTATPHRLYTGDAVSLDFSGNVTNGNVPWDNPTSVGSYSVASTPNATTFTVNATGLSSYSYTQAAGSNTVVITTTAPAQGEKVYLTFPAGTAPSGEYTVGAPPDATRISVTTTETAPTTARSGSLLMSKMSGAFVAKAGTPGTLTITTYVNHCLRADDRVWMHLTNASTQLANAERKVVSVIDETHFTVENSVTLKAETNSATYYPLAAPPLTRSGVFGQAASKFDLGSTDGTLDQTPLDAPTVFNFFYPDYQYPGALAAANATTPEFQLTTDTNIVNLTNAVNGMFLNAANTSGLSNFGSGAIMFDLGPFMAAPNSVANAAGVAALVDKLSDLLTGGTMSAEGKAKIAAFASNTTYFPTTATTNVRDRVRAIVQLILTSPEYAVQK